MNTCKEMGVAEDLRGLIRDILRDYSPVVGDARSVSADNSWNEVWQILIGAGLDRLTGREEAGGGGAGWIEASVLLQEFARFGTSVPFLEHDLLAGWLRDMAGLPAPNGGLSTVAFWGTDGDPREVAWLPWADTVVVLDARDGRDVTVFEIDAKSVSTKERRTINGELRHSVSLPHRVMNAHAVDKGAVVEFWRRGALGRAIQIAGAAAAIRDLCINHATSRLQFGRPLGRFQAVQHLVTNVAGAAAICQGIVDRAVLSVVTQGFRDDQSGFLIASAKSVTGGCADDLVRGAHQIHGAIGTTVEHSLHRFTRPVLLWQREFGSAVEWEAKLEALADDVGPDGLWDLVTR